MKVVYVAGPFRADTPLEIERNVRRAEDVGTEVWKAGAVGWVPHTNTRFMHGSLPDSVFLEGTLEQLKRCDAIIMVSGWERSQGAAAERAYALEHCMPVFYDVRDVASWVAGRGLVPGEPHSIIGDDPTAVSETRRDPGPRLALRSTGRSG